MPHTLVCFHAHPDDEALLTAGTMAKAAAAGHRVVLVVATRGEVGRGGRRLPGRRRGPRRPALGRAGAVGRRPRRGPAVWLGYADSGSAPGRVGRRRSTARRIPPAPVRFVDADVDEAAARWPPSWREERADVLTSYDPNGGYGHPDHVQVHRVGARAPAAELAGTPRAVLEAHHRPRADAHRRRAGPLARLRDAARVHARDLRSVVHPGRGHHPRGGRQRPPRPEEGRHGGPRQPGHRRRPVRRPAASSCSSACPTSTSPWPSAPSGSSSAGRPTGRGRRRVRQPGLAA